MKKTPSFFMYLQIILVFGLLSPSVSAKLIKKSVSFDVRPQGLRNDIHYGVKFYKENKPTFIQDFDAEGDSINSNRVTIFFKSALLIDSSLEDIDLSAFEKSSVHAEILDGQVLREYQDQPFHWRMNVKILVKNVSFDYQAFLTEGLTNNTIVNDYITASQDLDSNLPLPAYYLVQYLDNYNAALDRMITLSKIIPYNGKTLIVTYQLSQLYESFYSKYNIFNAVEKIFKKKLIQTIERTRTFLKK